MHVDQKNDSNETLACLVIDDLLIKPKYGCLDYKLLLHKMKAHRFFVEIAFIPWNYKRTNPETVKLLADNPDFFALCVHGCNHTGNEFGDSDYQKLAHLSNQALWRMDQLKSITGLDYDRVFVFPQGRFSSTAMKALKDQGFVAACNSTLKAVDTEDLCQHEYTKPATKVYYDFPLILRRYPEATEDFIKDIERGRPIIIVEHHGVFRHGYKAVTDLVDWINSQGHIKWTSLGEIANYYLEPKPSIEREKLTPPPLGLSEKMKISLRRYLSEIRDDYVETNDLLTKLYKALRS